MPVTLRRKITYANVASTLALALALSGGVAYAANTIYSSDIVDGQVKRVDIGASAVNSGKVGDNSLKGIDILESTLSGVNAETLGGHTAGSLIRVGGVTKRAAVDMPDCSPGLDYLVYSFDAPEVGFVLLNGTFTSQYGNYVGGGAIAARFERSDPSLSVGEWVESTGDTANSRSSMGLTQVFPVSVGTNTFSLKVCDNADAAGNSSTAISAQISAVFTPFGL
jgi:hypothetical protein